MTIHIAAEVIDDGYSLLEGPRWKGGSLWMSDFFTHRVLRVDDAVSTGITVSTVCVVEGQPSGLGFLPSGEILISSMLDRRVLSWDGSRLREVADLSGMVSGPLNDLAVDSDGSALVGNFGLDPLGERVAAPTPLIRVFPDGKIQVAAEDLIFPNGIVIDTANQRVLVAETYRGRVTAFDSVDGVLRNRTTWITLSEDPMEYAIPKATRQLTSLPDGLALDPTGAVWVADAIGRGASLINDAGHTVVFVSTGAYSAYAVAVGGAREETLYLCCAPPAESFDPTTEFRSVLMRADLCSIRTVTQNKGK
jgi:sugar lactone lactonase YvrE